MVGPRVTKDTVPRVFLGQGSNTRFPERLGGRGVIQIYAGMQQNTEITMNTNMQRK
jgi:hypothetical protein